MLDPHEGLQRLHASGLLFVLIEQACSAIFYKGLFHFSNTAIGLNSGCVVFYGPIIAILFCILYIYFTPVREFSLVDWLRSPDYA